MDSTTTYMRSPGAVAVPILAFITVVLCLPPFIWHVKSRNIPASTLVFWILINNLFSFINALIWPTDDIASWWSGVGLCDVEVKVITASFVGVAGSLICIFRQLAMVLNTDRTVLVPSQAQRRRRLAIEILLCFAFPIFQMGIHYIVQPNRYYIFAITGCTPSYDNSWPSIVLVFMWPPILCVVDTIYCCLVIYRLNKYRRQFAQIISSSDSNLNKSRFIRLFILALSFVLILLPLQMYIFYRNLSFPRLPYSWSAIHGPNWWDIVMVPTEGSVTFDCWIVLGCGFLVFFFFGFGKDATLMYRSWILKLGLGKCFPSLKHPHIPPPGHSTASFTSRIGSFSSRARLVFARKFSRGHSVASLPTPTDSIATTEVVTPSPSDPKKTFAPFPAPSEKSTSTKSSTPRFWNPFSFRKSRQDRQEIPVSTVEANVWSAGRNDGQMESPTRNGTIKVKKEVRQMSEHEKEVVYSRDGMD